MCATRGEGPQIGLAARRNGMSPITLRFERMPGLIGNGPLPFESLASWGQPIGSNPEIQAEVAKRMDEGTFISRLSALQLAFSVEPAAGLPDLLNSFLADRLPSSTVASRSPWSVITRAT